MIKKKKRRVIYKADYANYAQVQILLLAAQRASRSARVKEIHSYTSPIVCGARIRCRFPPFSRTEVSSRTLPGSCLERWCCQPALIMFDLLVPATQSASYGGESPGPFPACCGPIRKPIENVMKSNMKAECMSRPVESAKQPTSQINGIKSIVGNAQERISWCRWKWLQLLQVWVWCWALCPDHRSCRTRAHSRVFTGTHFSDTCTFSTVRH